MREPKCRSIVKWADMPKYMPGNAEFVLLLLGVRARVVGSGRETPLSMPAQVLCIYSFLDYIFFSGVGPHFSMCVGLPRLEPSHLRSNTQL